MTRNSITKLKKNNKVNNLKSNQAAIINMLSLHQNDVRPRRTHNWNNYFNDEDYNQFRYNYNNDYNRTHTISFQKQSYPRKKENRKNKLEAVKNYFRDYCSGTSLHGLRYVGAEGVSVFERLFWITAFVGAMCFAAFFISNIYVKWVDTPIIVGIDPEFKLISNIPFPAITICNMNQARKAQAERILRGGNTAEKILLLDICNANDSAMEASSVEIKKAKDWTFIQAFILQVSQPCSDLLIHCKWQGNDIPCSKILNSALTDEGVCCTFNRVASEFMYYNPLSVGDFNVSIPENNINWNPENGYPETANETTWPFRPSGAGQHVGLTLTINISADDYYCSSTSSVGLKIRLHSPVESPMMSDYGFFIHPRKEVRVAIRTTMDEASPTIKSIPIIKRQCFFSVEKHLYYYRTYTKLNCELECLSNFTLQQCGCVPFYLPKNENSTICDKTAETCYRQTKNDLDIEARTSSVCDCLPACNEIQYGQDHSLGDISNPSLRKKEAKNIDPPNLIILHFFYQTTQFRSYKKNELFGFTEFLSNSGGLLGLFLGFSFLSAVEIVYHLTLRLWCVYYRKHNNPHRKTMSVVYPFAK